MFDVSTTVLAAFDGGYVVGLTYERSIVGDSRGRYTANYYLSGERTIRAEAAGERSPGPNPTKSGVIVAC